MIHDQNNLDVPTQPNPVKSDSVQNGLTSKSKKKQIAILEINSSKYPIYEGTNVIGRDIKSDICIRNVTVSKRHAEIETDDEDTIFITDLSSLNGTQIKNKFLKPNKSYQIVSGNAIYFGEVCAIFKVTSEINNFAVPQTPLSNKRKSSLSNSLNVSKSFLDETLLTKSSSVLENSISNLPTQITSSTPKVNSINKSSIIEENSIIEKDVIPESPEMTESKKQKPQKTDNEGESEDDMFQMSTKSRKSLNGSDDAVEKNMRSLFGESCASESNFDSSRMMTQQLENVLQMSPESERSSSLRNKRLDFVKQQDSSLKLSTDSTDSDNYYAQQCLKRKHNELQDSDDDNTIKRNKKGIKKDTIEQKKEIEEIESKTNDIIPESDEEDDDILKDLPKFDIPNTLSNPASPLSEASDVSEDFSNLKNTPRSLKYKAVMQSLKSSKIFAGIKDDFKELEELGNRVLQIKSAYDNIKDPLLGDDADNDDQDTQNNSIKKVEVKPAKDDLPETSTSGTKAKRGRPKKSQMSQKIANPSGSPRMNPLMVQKIKPAEENDKELRVVLQPVNISEINANSKDNLVDEKLDNKSDNKITNKDTEKKLTKTSKVISSKRNTRKSHTVKEVEAKCSNTEETVEKNDDNNEKMEVKSNDSDLSVKIKNIKSRRKRGINEINESGEKVVKAARGRPKKMKIEEKESNDMEEKKSPIIGRRLSQRQSSSQNLSQSLNNSVQRQNSLNKSPRKTKIKVLFTGVDVDNWKSNLIQLGISEATNVSQCSVLLTNKVIRTTKFLCCVAKGIPIISLKWLEDSCKANECLDFEDYLLQDIAAEKKFGFNLRESLKLGKEKQLYKGLSILLTPKIDVPPIHELCDIIKAAGGIPVVNLPRKWPQNIVIVTSENDMENAKKFAAKAPKEVTVHSKEFILSGILRQQIDLKSFMIEF